MSISQCNFIMQDYQIIINFLTLLFNTTQYLASMAWALGRQPANSPRGAEGATMALSTDLEQDTCLY